MMCVTSLKVIFISCVLWMAKTTHVKAVVIKSALVGNSVYLPCNIRSNVPNDSTELVLWYRDTLEKPIFKMDMRNVNYLKKAKLHNTLSNRAAFNAQADPANLEIQRLQQSDSGTYRCRVDFRIQRTVNRKIKLIAIVLPNDPVITNEQGEKLNGVVGPYNEGEDAVFACTVENGIPVPNVTWSLNTKIIDTVTEDSRVNIVKNTLILRSIPREADGQKLICKASNTNQSSPKSASVTLRMNYRPLTVAITAGKKPLSAGIKAKMECKTSGSRPPAAISWWKGSQKIEDIRQTILASGDNNTTLSIMNFIPTPEDNGKHLSCRASNAEIPRSAIEDGWNIIVHYVPKLKLKIRDSNKFKLREGDDVYIECVIRANPWITNVAWTFSNQTINNRRQNYDIKGQSLVIKNVQMYHMGKYVCVGTNSQGTGYSQPIDLFIEHAPVCSNHQVSTYGATYSERIQVSCRVNANPSDVQFRWWMNTTSGLMRNITNFRQKGKFSVATIYVSDDEDYGMIFCAGSNIVGSQEVACFFNIVKASLPDSVENCTIVNETTSSVHVECNSGRDGGINQRFYAEVYLRNHILKANISALNQPKFNIMGLKPSTEYMIVIYSVNDKGRSPSVAVMANTLDDREHDNGSALSLLVTPMIGTLAGVVLTLLTVLLVAICLVRWKNKKSEPQDQIVTKKKEEDSAEEKSYSDIEILNPDVVPLNTVESVSGSLCPIYMKVPAPYLDRNNETKVRVGGSSSLEGGFVTLKQNGDVGAITSTNNTVIDDETEIRYAELSIVNCCGDPKRVFRSRDNDTEYAKIDFKKLPTYDGGGCDKATFIHQDGNNLIPFSQQQNISASSSSRLESSV